MGRFDFKSLLVLLVVIIVAVVIVKMFTKSELVDSKGNVVGTEKYGFSLPFTNPNPTV